MHEGVNGGSCDEACDMQRRGRRSEAKTGEITHMGTKGWGNEGLRYGI